MRVVPEALDYPYTLREPSNIFVNSMSDLFHENLSVDDIRRVCRVMERVDRHTYQILTKRAGRMRKLLSGSLGKYAELPQILWGTSVENKRHGLPRIEELRRTPARTRFLSVEPLLEDLGRLDLTGIDWVIVGGGSGASSRPMEADWVRSIRDQCVDQNVNFYFKQWGGRKKKAAGKQLDGRTWEEMPARLPLPMAS